MTETTREPLPRACPISEAFDERERGQLVDEMQRLRAALANVVSKCSLACDVIEPDERGQKMQAAFRVIETYCLRALGHEL